MNESSKDSDSVKTMVWEVDDKKARWITASGYGLSIITYLFCELIFCVIRQDHWLSYFPLVSVFTLRPYSLLLIILSLLGVVLLMILHEGLHGIVLFLLTRHRPRFGLLMKYKFLPLGAYTTLDIPISRNTAIASFIAPSLVLTPIAFVLGVLCPEITMPVLLFISLNLGGSVQDLYLIILVGLFPSTVKIQLAESGLAIIGVPEEEWKGSLLFTDYLLTIIHAKPTEVISFIGLSGIFTAFIGILIILNLLSLLDFLLFFTNSDLMGFYTQYWFPVICSFIAVGLIGGIIIRKLRRSRGKETIISGNIGENSNK